RGLPHRCRPRRRPGAGRPGPCQLHARGPRGPHHPGRRARRPRQLPGAPRPAGRAPGRERARGADRRPGRRGGPGLRRRRPRGRHPRLRAADAGAARRRCADHRRRLQREPRLDEAGAEDARPPRPGTSHHRRARGDARARRRHRAPPRRDRPPRGAPEHRPAVRGRRRCRPHPPRGEPRRQLRRGVRAPRDRRGGARRAAADRAPGRRGAAEVLPRRRAPRDRRPPRGASRRTGGGRTDDRSRAVIAIIVSVLAAFFLTHLVLWTAPSVSVLLVLFLAVGLGVVGFRDDYLKISQQDSTGLRPRYKLLGQFLVATAFAVMALLFPDENGLTPASTRISLVRDIPWLDLAAFGTVIGIVLFAIWANFLVAAWSNGVNLTDGLDGLASGATIIFTAAYLIISFWQWRQVCN